jgi:menaquinone-dependent protoporphyrinogen oxidase
MKIAIVYVSKYGTTEKVAASIAEKLTENNEVELFALNKNANPNVNGFEAVILGTPIYAGQAAKKMKAFCQTNETGLLQKKTGLFVCGMEIDKSKIDSEFKNAYSEILQKNAAATAFLGGAFLFERMNFFERMIIKKIAKTTTSVQRIDEEAMNEFVEKLQQ